MDSILKRDIREPPASINAVVSSIPGPLEGCVLWAARVVGERHETEEKTRRVRWMARAIGEYETHRVGLKSVGTGGLVRGSPVWGGGGKEPKERVLKRVVQ